MVIPTPLRMQYIKYLPSDALKNFVECYFVWQSPTPPAAMWIDAPPSAYAAFVFNLADPYAVKLEEDRILHLPKSFVSGQSIRNYTLRIESNIEQVGIVFKPTGLFHLFGLPSYELTNTRIDIHDILHRDFYLIEERLHEATDSIGRIRILENLLLIKLEKNEPDLDGVDIASLRIIKEFGNLNVGDLIADAYMSRRKFERHFFKRVGLSPKYYARIRRYGYLCSLIAGKRSVNWDEVLYKVGYYDQSHFIKDFKEFSGISPNQYLISNNELAHKVQVEIG